MPLKTTYRKDAPFITTYSFADTVSGNSYIIFYGGKTNFELETDTSYETGNDTGAEGVLGGTTWYAQTFTIRSSGFWCDTISLYAGKDGSAGALDIKIQEVDGSNKPDGTDLATGSTGTGGTPDFVDITLNKTLFLSANTTYAIVMDPNFSDVDNHWTLWFDGSSPTYTGGNYLKSTNSGSAWTADTAKDFLFKVLGASVNPYRLFTQAFTSDPNQETGKNNIILDLPILKALTIEGNYIININTNGQTDIKVELLHVRGTVETSMGSRTGKTDTTRKAFSFDLTKTTFVKNDILRLKVSSETGNFTIDYSDSGKVLTSYIPFKTV